PPEVPNAAESNRESQHRWNRRQPSPTRRPRRFYAEAEPPRQEPEPEGEEGPAHCQRRCRAHPFFQALVFCALLRWSSARLCMSHREALRRTHYAAGAREPHVFRVALLLLEWQAIDHCAIQNCLTGGLQSNGNPQSILVRVWLQPYRRKSVR